MTMQPTTLVSLPDDVLLAIAKSVAGNVTASNRGAHTPYAKTVSRLETAHCPSISCRSGKHPLIPLSMTCSRLRNVYQPVIFNFVVLDSPTVERDVKLHHVLKHARAIHACSILLMPTFDSILAAATGLRELKFGGDSVHLPSIFALPTLVDITLCAVDIGWRAPKIRSPPSALQAFRIVDSTRWAGIHKLQAANLRAERDLIQKIMLANRECVKELVLPGETTLLRTLAAAPWPALRELALAGAYPEDGGTVPLVDVLGMLPVLRVFTFGLAPRRCQSSLYVWPPGLVPAHPLALDHLTRLSLSFPHEDDAIFGCIPPDLEELALRDSPRYYSRFPPNALLSWSGGTDDQNEVGYAAPGPLLTCAGAARIFSVLPTLRRLVRLELVVQAVPGDLSPAEADLYAQIAAWCPAMRVFELHRYRAPDDSARSVPVAAIIEALTAFRELAELRLNLDLPLPGLMGGFCVGYSAKMAVVLESTARLVAAALPWLEHIALLERNNANMHQWAAWDVHVTGEGVLVEKDPVSKSDMSWL